PGGLTVSLAGFSGDTPVEVDVLWGGAMSFTREALAGIPLDNLVTLYEAGIGRGEDAVLSSRARRLGKLFILNQPFALHPPLQTHDVATPYAKNGWDLGMTQTFGRAHTMRWLAVDRAAYVRDWWRFVSFDFLRCLRALVCRPWRASGWKYLGGAVYGIVLTLVRWRRIPDTPKSDIEVLELNRAPI
ncbi:MAG TPA: hypothetical protein VE007_12575, partial [Thermoanaerobaculia bacterium]|nr:hypothetical protein [Thermoanaerobaculia bacterium]